MEKCRLADLVTELGFSCEKNLAESDRVCAKCATKIRNASELMRYLKSGFLAPQEQPIAMTCSHIAAERFKRTCMSGSPHSAKSGKISRGDSPKENTISKARHPFVSLSLISAPDNNKVKKVTQQAST